MESYLDCELDSLDFQRAENRDRYHEEIAERENYEKYGTRIHPRDQPRTIPKRERLLRGIVSETLSFHSNKWLRKFSPEVEKQMIPLSQSRKIWKKNVRELLQAYFKETNSTSTLKIYKQWRERFNRMKGMHLEHRNSK